MAIGTGRGLRAAVALVAAATLGLGCSGSTETGRVAPPDATGGPSSPTPTTEPALTPTTSGGVPDPRRWQPAAGATWQWQLSGPIDTTVDAEVFDLDLYEVPDDVLAQLRAQGRRLICYVNAGAHEPWRADADQVDLAVIGQPLEGWPDERWFDVRRIDLLGPVLEARLATCAARGFDGVELDNVDGYANDTGFPLTAEDQVAFNRFLADTAHRHGLAAGLKNAVDLVPDLVDDFDFAVNEECAAYDECDALRPFVEQGKAVFHVEYDVAVEEFCPESSRLGLSSLRKRLALDAWRETCS